MAEGAWLAGWPLCVSECVFFPCWEGKTGTLMSHLPCWDAVLRTTCLPVLFMLCPLENVALPLLMTRHSLVSKDKEISDKERIREMRGVTGQRASLEGWKKTREEEDLMRLLFITSANLGSLAAGCGTGRLNCTDTFKINIAVSQNTGL